MPTCQDQETSQTPSGCCLPLLLPLLLSHVQIARTRYQMHKSITPDYYGFRDEEDGVLLAAEAEAEKTILAQVRDEYEPSVLVVTGTDRFSVHLSSFQKD